jgi:hypothetical protein
MQRVYLTRRNLLTLLAKLDRQAQGDMTACTIVKTDTKHSLYPCTDTIVVTAIEDAIYYIDREPGEVLAVDEPGTLHDQS